MEYVSARDKGDNVHTYASSRGEYMFYAGIKINQTLGEHNSSSDDINATVVRVRRTYTSLRSLRAPRRACPRGRQRARAGPGFRRAGAPTGKQRRRERAAAGTERGGERPSLGMFSPMRGDTAKALPARNFIDDEIRNRRDLPPRRAPSIIYK